MPQSTHTKSDVLAASSLPLRQSVGGVIGCASARPKAILSGSFNPLHHGHLGLASVSGLRLGCEVEFELSVANVDKPPLGATEVAARLGQFVGVGAVWVTKAATFEAKADLFHGVAFVIGFDTAARLIDPKYYATEHGRDAALSKLLARGCRFVVGGRTGGDGVFRYWDATFDRLRVEFRPLFEVIPEADFRVDVSSTELRRIGSERNPT